jgi:hypothetical protein
MEVDNDDNNPTKLSLIGALLLLFACRQICTAAESGEYERTACGEVGVIYFLPILSLKEVWSPWPKTNVYRGRKFARKRKNGVKTVANRVCARLL